MNKEVLQYGNTAYNIVKWVVAVVLPAFATMYFALGSQLNLPNVEQVVGVTTAIATFLGVTMGISGANYKATNDPKPEGNLIIEEKPDGGYLYDFDADDWEKIRELGKVAFNVIKK